MAAIEVNHCYAMPASLFAECSAFSEQVSVPSEGAIVESLQVSGPVERLPESTELTFFEVLDLRPESKQQVRTAHVPQNKNCLLICLHEVGGH